MRRYAAALSRHPVPVEAVGETAGEIIERFEGDRPDLVVCFASSHHVGAIDDIGEGLRALLEPDVLVGAAAHGVVGGAREIEEEPALAVFAAGFGGGHARGFALDVEHTADSLTISGWPDDLPARGTLLLLTDGFSFPAGDLLRICNAHAPGLEVVGGVASVGHTAGGNRLLLDGAVRRQGAVGVLLDESVPVRSVVSQGCRPIGRPFTITRAERNVIGELAGQPAIERLREVALALPEPERELLRSGLHVGIVVDEHKVDFRRGDFLVRNLVGADEQRGAIAVSERVDVGQTVQFHLRDAESADEDLRLLLGGKDARAALLFTCNGRGSGLFGVPDHDAAALEDALGPIPVAGAFCAGEFGPVGGRNHLHGLTASLVLFG